MKPPSRSPLAVIFMTVVLDLIGFGLVIPLLPLYAQTFSASGAQIGLLFAAYSLMQFIFAPLWGRLSDRVGRRPVLLTSIGINCLSFLVLAWAPSYPWLLLARVISGVCTANIGVATAYIADITTPSERARGMGLIGAAFGIGFVIGPAMAGELVRFGAATPMLAAATLALVNFAGAVVLLPESLPQAVRAALPPRGSRWALLRQVPVKRFLALGFLHMTGFAMLEVSFVLFASRRLGFDAQDCGRTFAYIGAVLILVQGVLIGPLVARLGERRLVLLGLAALGVSLGVTPLLPAEALLLFALCATLIAAGNGVAQPSLQSSLSRRAPAAVQGGVMSLWHSAAALGRVVGPQVGGVVLDLGNEGTPLFVASGIIAVALVFAAMVLQSSPDTASA